MDRRKKDVEARRRQKVAEVRKETGRNGEEETGGIGGRRGDRERTGRRK